MVTKSQFRKFLFLVLVLIFIEITRGPLWNNKDIKLTTGYKSLKILASVIGPKSLGKIIKMMGFWVTKSEIWGPWVTN